MGLQRFFYITQNRILRGCNHIFEITSLFFNTPYPDIAEMVFSGVCISRVSIYGVCISGVGLLKSLYFWGSYFKNLYFGVSISGFCISGGYYLFLVFISGETILGVCISGVDRFRSLYFKSLHLQG